MPTHHPCRGTIILSLVCGTVSSAGLAQTTAAKSAPAQTAYAFCTSMNPATQTIYFSDAFSFSKATTPFASLSGAFFESVKLRDSGAANANCTPGTTLAAASQTKQVSEAKVKSVSQNMAAINGKPLQIVETGWRYAEAASTGTAAAGTGLSSVGNSVAASGQDIGNNLQSTMNQTVQGVEGSTVNTVASSVNSMSTAAQASIQSGMQNLQTKMFHHAKPAPTAAAPVQAGVVAAPTTTQMAVSPTATITPASLVTTAAPVAASAAAPAPASKPTIQDEGDGKHFILMLPGQADAHELTLTPGSKNIYIEEATGDKYIVMPSGDITHILHKNAAK